MSAAHEIHEALAAMDSALLRAIALLSVEAKPGLEVDRDALEETRDLIVEAYRDLRGVSRDLPDLLVMPAAEVTP